MFRKIKGTKKSFEEVVPNRAVVLYVDMDGTIVKWVPMQTESEEEVYDILKSRHYFLKLPPAHHALNAVKELLGWGLKVKILTSYLSDSAYALDEKRLWLNKYLPEVEERDRIYVPYGIPKAEYLGSIGPNDVLLDDYTKNLREWEVAGGTGIKFLNSLNHTRKTWSGAKVSWDSKTLAEDIMTAISV